MQEAETRKGGMIWGMAFHSHGRFFKRMSLIAMAFLAMLAIITITYAQETESIRYEPTPLWPYHALMMSTGLVAMLAGMITARYMKGKKWWLKAHKNLGITGAFLTVAGFAVAVYMVLSYSGVYFVGGSHANIGITAVVLAVFTPIMGYMQFQKNDKRIRIIHRWSGRLVIAMMLINAAVGWMMISAT